MTVPYLKMGVSLMVEILRVKTFPSTLCLPLRHTVSSMTYCNCTAAASSNTNKLLQCFYLQTIKAQRAVTEMRGRYLKGSKLQADYASHECRAAFFEQCKNSGMDMKERSKPWEIHQPHLTAANENSNSPDSIYRYSTI